VPDRQSVPAASGDRRRHTQIAGSLANMFDFDGGHAFGERRLILDPSTGQPLH
jgi:hypothetical protein